MAKKRPIQPRAGGMPDLGALFERVPPVWEPAWDVASAVPGAIYGAATALPGLLQRATTGNYAMSDVEPPGPGGTSPQAVRDAFELAGYAGTGALGTQAAMKSARAPAGALGVFAGPRAGKDWLYEANFMKSRGATPQDIWEGTGWFQTPDGMWKREIPDYYATATDTPLTKFIGQGEDAIERGTMRSIMQHEPLYKAYPEIAMMQTRINPGLRQKNWLGSYTPAWKGNDPYIELARRPSSLDPKTLDTPLHEVMHGIQALEGWPSGSNANWFTKSMFRNQFPEKVLRDLESNPAKFQQMYDKWRRGKYSRNLGEVEARAVEARQGLPPEVLQKRGPWEDYEYWDTAEWEGKGLIP